VYTFEAMHSGQLNSRQLAKMMNMAVWQLRYFHRLEMRMDELRFPDGDILLTATNEVERALMDLREVIRKLQNSGLTKRGRR